MAALMAGNELLISVNSPAVLTHLQQQRAVEQGVRADSTVLKPQTSQSEEKQLLFGFNWLQHLKKRDIFML